MPLIEVNGEAVATSGQGSDLTEKPQSSERANRVWRRIFATDAIPVQTFVLACLLGLVVWVAAPDVNEAHYLAKARHFWDRSFCQNDIFVSSHESHWLFYASHGWLFQWLSFPQVAWLGRMLSWCVVAWGLVLLLRRFDNRPGFVLVAGCTITVLNEYMNLAGEWFVGGVEGKGYAYGFCFAALAMWFQGNKRRAWVLAGLASAFHILAGLWFVIAAGLAGAIMLAHGRFKTHRTLKPIRAKIKAQARATANVISPGTFISIAAAAIAIVFFLIGLIPAIIGLIMPTAEWAHSVSAGQIQSMNRLSHHQLATEFGRWHLFLAMVAGWLILWRTTCHHGVNQVTQIRLNLIVLGSLVISMFGVVLSGLAVICQSILVGRISADLLTLYWFRLADVLVPLGLVVNGWAFLRCFPEPRQVRLEKAALLAGACLTVWAVIANFHTNHVDPRSGSARQAVRTPQDRFQLRREIEAERNWIETCQWIRQNTAKESVFATPRQQQTFKWYAHRAEVANWKDMPQDKASLVEWYDRFNLLYEGKGRSHEKKLNLSQQLIDPFLMPFCYGEKLAVVLEHLKVDYLVAEQRVVDEFVWMDKLPDCLQQVYPEPGKRKSTYVVYRFLNLAKKQRTNASTTE